MPSAGESLCGWVFAFGILEAEAGLMTFSDLVTMRIKEVVMSERAHAVVMTGEKHI